MENLLQGITKVCVYIDDILITGSTEAEHLEKLAEVLERLTKTGMRLKRINVLSCYRRWSIRGIR